MIFFVTLINNNNNNNVIYNHVNLNEKLEKLHTHAYQKKLYESIKEKQFRWETCQC